MNGDSTSIDTHRPRLECPRCGHALDPIVAAARAAGTEGVVCGECGLATTVAAVETAGAWPRWLVEAPGSLLGLPSRACSTLARALLVPYRFWSSVPMERGVSLRGMVTLVVALAVALHLVAFAMRVARLPPAASGLRSAADVAWAAASPGSPFLGSQLVDIARAPEDPDPRIASTARRFIRRLPQAWWLLGPDLTRDEADSWGRPWIQSFGALPPFYFRRNPTLTNLDVYPKVLGDETHGRIMGVQPPLTTFIPEKLALGFLLGLLPTACLFLLPRSLRRARVRPRHIVRGFAYALIPASVAASVLLAVLPDDWRWPVLMLPTDSWTIAIVAISIATMPWTHAYCSRYVRIRHALGVAAAATALTALCGLLLTAFMMTA